MRKIAGQARSRQPVITVRERLRPWFRRAAQMLLLIVLTVTSIWCVTWLQNPTNMPLRTVRIEGELHKLTIAQMQNAIATTARGGFFTVDADAIRRAAESLPWVESVTVRRVWPDTLKLRVVEQRAAARWGEKGVLSRSGQLFMPDQASIPQRLPQLNGPDELRRRVMEMYIAMSNALAPIGRRVEQLQIDNRRAWVLKLDTGVELKLGRDQAIERLQRFVRVYPTVFAAREEELTAVDLRYSNGFAVRWDRTPKTAGQKQEG